MTHIDPSRENWEQFKSLPRDTPIQMLNLIKLRDLAEYPPGHSNHGKGLTGREAYAIYGKAFQALVADDGAAMVWQVPLECVVTGPPGEWDEAFVMGYPNSATFMAHPGTRISTLPTPTGRRRPCCATVSAPIRACCSPAG
jgi:hypothetical protein